MLCTQCCTYVYKYCYNNKKYSHHSGIRNCERCFCLAVQSFCKLRATSGWTVASVFTSRFTSHYRYTLQNALKSHSIVCRSCDRSVNILWADPGKEGKTKERRLSGEGTLEKRIRERAYWCYAVNKKARKPYACAAVQPYEWQWSRCRKING